MSTAAPIALMPYRMAVPQALLDDLQQRLQQTRRPHRVPDTSGKSGVSPDLLDAVLERWRSGYDWREWEARFNQIPQYRVEFADVTLHVLLERGSGSNPTPVILTHGWPGSPAELLELIMPLAHPERFGGNSADGLTVVVPSLPGTGFSGVPGRWLSPRDLAGYWQQLMAALGYHRYLAHGGDIGAAVSSWLALDYPESVIGVHLNNAVMLPAWTLALNPPSVAEQAFLAQFERRLAGETAYQLMHGTKPQTLSYALADSPAGLAAWILEKCHSWSVGDLRQPCPLDTDHLITNLMLYWLGDAGATTWIYRYLLDMSGFTLPDRQQVSVPAAFCLFPQDIALPPPDSWLARGYNVQHCTRAASGGHFPGIQCPQVLIDDIQLFASAMRSG